MAEKNVLTVLQVENAKSGLKPVKIIIKAGGLSKAGTGTVPTQKSYKLKDDGGLYLVVCPNGSKYWHFRYQFDGEKKISLGVYPKMSLAEARTERDQTQRELSKGINPSVSRKSRRLASSKGKENTFRAWPLNGSPRFLQATVNHRITEGASGQDLRMTFFVTRGTPSRCHYCSGGVRCHPENRRQRLH